MNIKIYDEICILSKNEFCNKIDIVHVHFSVTCTGNKVTNLFFYKINKGKNNTYKQKKVDK